MHPTHLDRTGRKFPARVVAQAALLVGLGLAIAPAVTQIARADGFPVETLAGMDRPAPTEAAITSNESNDVDQIYNLDVGDRVKVSVYGREDLSGLYTVNDMGKVRIPTLGAFTAAGSSPLALEDQISAAIEKVMQRKADVTIDVSGRRPVFVSGLVAKPGSYPFIRDMTVIQALTLAGGSLSSATMPWLPTEALREMSRLRTSDIEYKRLVARQARLLADKEDRTEIATPAMLVNLVGTNEASRLIGDEQRYYNTQRESLQSQIASIKEQIQQAKIEVDSYVKEQAIIEDQLVSRRTMRDTIQKLAKGGLTTQQRLTDTEILVAMVERDQRQVAANIARGRQNISRLDRELAVLTLDRHQAIEKELQGIDDQLANLETTINGSSKIIHQVGGLPADITNAEGGSAFRYEILRKNDVGGLMSISATDSTPLLPGDVVKVIAERTAGSIPNNNMFLDASNPVTNITNRYTSNWKN
ncbi:hypothetical protein DLM45_15455 [Hyphomicrobium methylovorum]|uniref:polysaccharide biosynthesis/export family protein n=1 Tax=Hyphomicrobium methylovorum TaxID=84 RepID=UPI0015E6BFD9|nr:polysaccharide biosynthesis/export family protein [Hyphomicrobium methylovorum]MBA2127608.1 hypothetical protein [Hyphomicrobium methylovorum]